MRILGFIALVIASVFFAHTVVSGGLPQFYRIDISLLHSLDDQAFLLLVLLFPAIYVPIQLVAGFLLDRYGARTTMMSAAALATLGLMLSVVVDIPAIGAAGRALHAMGAGFAFVGALYIAARSFSKSHFAIYAGFVQAFGFGAIGWWYLSGEASAELFDFPRHYYFAAGAAVVLALLFALFSNVKAVQDGADRPGVFRQLFPAIGSVLIRPRLWLIMIAMAFSAIPIGLYAPIWIDQVELTAQSRIGFAYQDVAALFALSFALGGLVAGYVSDGIGRRRGILFVFQLLAAAAFTIVAFSGSREALHIGALLAAGGFFSGSSVLFYALGNDRAPPHQAGLFLGLIHAAFVIGLAGSAYAASYVQPLTEIVDLTRYFAPICLAIAAILSLVVPDKGPMAIAGPLADWEKTKKKESQASSDVLEEEEGLEIPVVDYSPDAEETRDEVKSVSPAKPETAVPVPTSVRVAETSLKDEPSAEKQKPESAGKQPVDPVPAVTENSKSGSVPITGKPDASGDGVTDAAGKDAESASVAKIKASISEPGNIVEPSESGKPDDVSEVQVVEKPSRGKSKARVEPEPEKT